MTARTHHICFGAELGCSGANPCDHCRVVLEKNVFFWASHQMVLRGLMTVEAARTLASLWEQGWNNLHGWMAQDVEIASRSLDLSRVLIAPEGNAPPAVANVSAFPFFPPLPAEPPIAARPPVGLREVPFSFPVPPSQAPAVPVPASPVTRAVPAAAPAAVAATVLAPAVAAPRPPRTEMSIEDVVALATPVEVEAPSATASPSDISDASLNGVAHVASHTPASSPSSLKAES